MQHNKEFIEAQARIFKALGHPSRLLMVDALRDGEKCVCDLQALVGDDMSTISKHLAVLRDAGVVTRRKQGVNIYYSLALCHEHGPVAGKIRIRKTDEGKYFGVKTLKAEDTEAADEIREKHESLRRRKMLRSQEKI